MDFSARVLVKARNFRHEILVRGWFMKMNDVGHTHIYIYKYFYTVHVYREVRDCTNDIPLKLLIINPYHTNGREQKKPFKK